MIELNWNDMWYQTEIVAPELNQVRIKNVKEYEDLRLNFGTPIGSVTALEIANAAQPYSKFRSFTFKPQIALLVFGATRRTNALDFYFPLTKILNTEEKQNFYRLAGKIMQQPRLDIRIFAVQNTPMPTVWRTEYIKDVPEIGFFVACHIAEIFFYRQDILEKLMSALLRIWLYGSQSDFKRDGGAAGGNFSLEKGGIQLVLSRLFEGFKDKTPGVAPFLHEFGHLLDHFDVKQGRLTGSHGTLPGMRPDEGNIYVPKARELFLKGKALEMERYTYLQEHDYSDDVSLPIGHPYVFQNDTEFIAGYFEMFFRNPHYFAQQNPDLYESFVLTFGQDPRKVWAADFPFYIEQNQGFYKGEKRPPQHGLSI